MEEYPIGNCKHHGITRFVQEKKQKRCRQCRMDAVAKRRRRVREITIQEAGGRCCVCGYSKCVQALDFHHLDRATKSFSLSSKGYTRSLDKAREEAAKCVLVCANCHREIEAGITKLSAR